MPKELKKVLIMAGGTGGHVFPGLSMATFLRQKGIEVHWLGTSRGLESQLVPAAQIPLHLIKITGIRGKGVKSLLAAPFNISTAIYQSIRIIKTVKPDIVLGMGGFVSGPGGVASWLLRRPLIIHEQNAIAGTTNQILVRFAKKVLEGFPKSFKADNKVETVGNPIREEIECLPAPQVRFMTKRSTLHLLVLGGSLGAQALNDIVPKALGQLPTNNRPNVLHQTGDKNFDEVKKHYASMQLDADVKPFVKDMASAYGWADIVICRAGALTVSELCAAGIGAIFIPFPHAVDDHQTAQYQYKSNNPETYNHARFRPTL